MNGLYAGARQLKGRQQRVSSMIVVWIQVNVSSVSSL